jgi:hypothetical protein
MVEGTECVGIACSMWGKGLSAWDCVECVGLLCWYLVFSCSAWVRVYYAASLLFLLGFCSLLSCVISWALCVFYGGVFVFCCMWGRVSVFCACSALRRLIIYMFCA